MANRYCTRCDKELIEGKRFCGGCGLAAPEPAPIVESVPRCSRCAGELIPGKPFCHLCGQPVGSPVADSESAVPAEAQIPDPLPSAPAIFVPELSPIESAPAVTIQYSDWETVHPGGLPAAGSFPDSLPAVPSASSWDEPGRAPKAEFPGPGQWETEVEPLPTVPDSISEPAATATVQSETPSAALPVPVFEPEQAATHAGAHASEPEVAPEAENAPPAPGTSEVPLRQGVQDWNEPAGTELTPAEAAFVPPPVPAAPPLAPVAGPPPPRKSGLAIQMGIAAVLIVGALGYWAWHVYAGRQTTTTASTIATAANPTSQASTQDPTSGESTAQPGTQPAVSAPSSIPSQDSNPVPEADASKSGKPSAGVPLAPAPTDNAEAAQQPSPPPRVVLPDSSRSAHGNPTAPTPVFHQSAVPAAAQIPAQATPPRSGVLHYQGPAIHPGGIVVFDRLPKGRLKFTFDRSLWQQPLIQRNADGTQRLTLHSSQQSDQTACDVGWEITQ